MANSVVEVVCAMNVQLHVRSQIDHNLTGQRSDLKGSIVECVCVGGGGTCM